MHSEGGGGGDGYSCMVGSPPPLSLSPRFSFPTSSLAPLFCLPSLVQPASSPYYPNFVRYGGRRKEGRNEAREGEEVKEARGSRKTDEEAERR